MNIESISAPPPTGTPQARYASLHRAIEKGIASDATYGQLTRVCLELDREDEALRWFEHIESTTERFHLQNLLVRRGAIRDPDRSLRQHHEVEERQGIVEDCGEALQFLMIDPLPKVLIAAIVTFPVLIGAGGYLATFSASFLPWLALLPALGTLFAVGGLARMVATEATQGLEDAPLLKPAARLIDESKKFARDFAVLAPVAGGPRSPA